ncbi:sugar-binding transcriptional regulator [Streptomyces sp. NPDC057245]|uniref:sugar-binding transcriptional regulator n=1 Tax=Streptomyces sp. NPDC057245 TaxID=3346065 RepID=UPI003633C356
MAEPVETPPFAEPIDKLLAASVARRFYLDNRSKVEIAEEFDVSRFKVARLLAAAVAHDIVRIDISVPAELDASLGRALTKRFGLRHAVVVDVSRCEDGTGVATDHRRADHWLGTAAARLLPEITAEGDVLGLDGSHAAEVLGDAVVRLPCCEVVQLTGVHGRDLARDAAITAVRRTAAVAGGRAFPLHAPFLLPDAVTAALLRSQPATAETLTRFGTVNKAVVGVDTWDAPLSPLYGALSGPERERLRQQGARAELAGHVLDRGGRVLPTELNARSIGVSVSQLRDLTELIGVAGGGRSAGALHAALMSGLLTGVVTDATTAHRLLLHGAPDDPGNTPDDSGDMPGAPPSAPSAHRPVEGQR